MRSRPVLAALLTAALALTPALGAARDKDRGERERERDRGGLFGMPQPGAMPGAFVDRRNASSRGGGMSAGQAAREAQERNGGGKVLSVDPTGDGYRVKLLRRGDVRVLFIPDEH